LPVTGCNTMLPTAGGTRSNKLLMTATKPRRGRRARPGQPKREARFDGRVPRARHSAIDTSRHILGTSFDDQSRLRTRC
jgi:hypothetical protein